MCIFFHFKILKSSYRSISISSLTLYLLLSSSSSPPPMASESLAIKMDLNLFFFCSARVSSSFTSMDNFSLQNLKKHLPFNLYFFPCSLLAILFVLLTSFNGFSIFLFQIPPIPFKPQITAPRLKPMHQSSSFSAPVHALKEELTPTVTKSRPNLRVLDVNGSSPQRPDWNRGGQPMLRILRRTSKSKQFSKRAKEFFHGSASSSGFRCKVRFFMTWILSIESFGPRELFVIESLFKSHPNACLLIISESLDSQRGIRLLAPFWERGFHVAAMSPDFDYIFKNTLAEVWFNGLMNGTVDPGEVSLGQNLSNLIRLVVLFKYGGVYLDTDVIVLRSFTGLRNVIGAQTVDVETRKWSRLNNAVLIFDKHHPLLFKFIQEFALTFDGNKWGHNGPYLASRVVSRVNGRPGLNFSVLPPIAFYPVNWRRIRSLFHGPRPDGGSKWVEEKLRHLHNESFAVHLWNKQSGELKVEEGSIIAQIMSECCILCNVKMSLV